MTKLDHQKGHASIGVWRFLYASSIVAKFRIVNVHILVSCLYGGGGGGGGGWN